jgi:hypothetical protein
MLKHRIPFSQAFAISLQTKFSVLYVLARI